MTWAELQTRIYELTKTSSSDMTAALLNSYVTPAVSKVVSKLIMAGGRYQFDDANRADLPISVDALVSGQQDYSLNTAFLTIDRIEIKDASGNWHLLTQIDQQDLKGARGTALPAYRSTAGTPVEYDPVGSSVFLYPPPNYSQAASIRIYYSRAQLNFDYVAGTFSDGSGTTASSPGFNALFHDLIAYYVAYDYCLLNVPELSSGHALKISGLEKDILDFYGYRNRDYRAGLRPGGDSNR